MTLFSKVLISLLISNRCISGLMSNLIKTSWADSILGVFLKDPFLGTLSWGEFLISFFIYFKAGNYREVTFEENRPPGSLVYKVQAYDEDSGENGYMSYSIANLNSEEMPFEIDDFTGQIKSKRRLDYESDRRVYHLKIRASDWGTPYR